MAENGTIPSLSTLRPGRGRAPGLARALGNRIYRTDPDSGNLELANDALDPGASATPSTAPAPRRSGSPLSDVFAFDVPQPKKPSLGRTLGGLATNAAINAGLKEGVKRAGRAIGDAITARQISAGTAGKPIESASFRSDEFRTEALQDAGLVDEAGFAVEPQVEGVDVIGAADLGDAGAVPEPTKGYADFEADYDFGDDGGSASGGATAAVEAVSSAADLASSVGQAGVEGAEAALGADALPVPNIIGPAIHLARGDEAAAAGSAIGGAIGSTFGPVGTVVGSAVGGQLGEPVQNVADETANVITDFDDHVLQPVTRGLSRGIGRVADKLFGGGDGWGPLHELGQRALQQIGHPGCYITEAVTAGGGQDNAPELETLRWFRDNVLVQTPQGQELVAEYEQAAPAIVQAISQRPDGNQILQGILTGYIQPAVEAVRRGQFDEALRIYAEMSAQVSELAIEITDDPELEQLLEEFAQEAAEVSHDGEMAGVATGTGTEMMHPGDQMAQQAMSRPMPHQPQSRLGRIFVGS